MGDKLAPSIVLDTNQLVSSVIRYGSNSHQVLELALKKEVKLYYSHEIWVEYLNVLYRPKFSFEPKFLKCLLDSVAEVGIIIYTKASSIELPDETDRKFYDAAKASGSYLITGNLKHYPQDDASIMPPVNFLKLIADVF